MSFAVAKYTTLFGGSDLGAKVNKEDLFRVRVPMALIKNTFPDYEGAPGDVEAGKES